MLRKRTILLTGGTGLIGSHLLRSIDDQEDVVVLSRNGHVGGASTVISLDLGSDWSADDLPDDIDVIVHLAQSEHYRDFPNSALDVFTVNTFSTMKLLDFARSRGVKNFVLASSGGVYGTGANSFSEDEDIIAKSQLGFYIGSRLCAEIISECYAQFFNIVTLRFFFVYGSGQRANMLIPRLVETIKQGKPIQLAGEKGLSINPVHVSDTVKAIRNAMLMDGTQKFNVAGPQVLSLRDIAETIGEALGRTPVFEVHDAKGNADLIGDISRMRVSLCEPTVKFSDGIREYIESLPK